MKDQMEAVEKAKENTDTNSKPKKASKKKDPVTEPAKKIVKKKTI